MRPEGQNREWTGDRQGAFERCRCGQTCCGQWVAPRVLSGIKGSVRSRDSFLQGRTHSQQNLGEGW